MAKPKPIVDPTQAIATGLKEAAHDLERVAESVQALAPEPTPEVPGKAVEPSKPAFDVHDPKAVRPGFTPTWPACYQTFELPEGKLALDVVLSDGFLFKMSGPVVTANADFASLLFPVHGKYGLRYSCGHHQRIKPC